MGRNQIKGSDSNEYQFYCDRHFLPPWKVPSCPQGLPPCLSDLNHFIHIFCQTVSAVKSRTQLPMCAPSNYVHKQLNTQNRQCVNIKRDDHLPFFNTGECNTDGECPVTVRTVVTHRTLSCTLNPSLGFLYFVLDTSRALSSSRKKHID